MTQERDIINGTVEKFLFQNEENGFGIFILKTKHTESTIVKGYCAHVTPGEHVTIHGSWVTHPKFGRQFEAQTCTTEVPTSTQGLIAYLSSGLIRGIGPIYAEKLVKHFQNDVLDIIDTNPERLKEVPGIGSKRIETIITAWKDQKAISHVMVFLQEHGVSPAYATKIYKKHGTQSVARVKENPYRLAEDIWGIGFKIADDIAQSLGISHNSIDRIKAGILFTITTAVGNGHVYVPLDELRITTKELLALSDADASNIKTALHTLHEEQKIVLVTFDTTHYITRNQYFYTEQQITKKLQFLTQKQSIHTFDNNAIYNKLRTGHYGSISLSEDQQNGILSTLTHKVTIITGGPGTGKTTLVQCLLEILDEHNIPYKLTAPTGRAAKRMSESTKKPAVTIHRLLEFDPHIMNFVRNEQNAVKTSYIIVDEASMIDMFLMHALLKAVPEHAHVIFLGDVDQLPSVGAGNVLNDMIASEQLHCVRLSKIFRQAQDSLIITNAHRINAGQMPLSSRENGKRDFLFFKEQTPDFVTEQLTKIYTQILPRYKIKSSHCITLVPMKRGIVGAHTLNQTLQKIINPNTELPIVQSNGSMFKQGDQVMQTKNNYDKNIFNGDIGYIASINKTEGELTVLYPEQSVVYEKAELDELILAYAISIHKSQGSEFDAVVVPLFMNHFTLLQRNLIYTAITRAKKLCIFLGQTKAVAVAIKNNTQKKRITFLKEHLTTGVVCR